MGLLFANPNIPPTVGARNQRLKFRNTDVTEFAPTDAPRATRNSVSFGGRGHDFDGGIRTLSPDYFASS
jgi:hypothetical protein